MSDNWGNYFTNMGGHMASIVFDDGISHEINNIDLPMAVRVKIKIKHVSPIGFSESAEWEQHYAFQQSVQDAVWDAGGIYLGTVTVNGVLWVLGLLPEENPGLTDKIKALAVAADNEIEIFVQEDKEKAVYWNDLYPTPDDRRVMKDLDVLDVLAENNDDNAAERPVNHWSYFNTKEAAEKFAKSLNPERFQGIKIEEPVKNEEGQSISWCVRAVHHGTMLLEDITGHTIELARLAEEAGGEYDGWETLIVKADAA